MTTDIHTPRFGSSPHTRGARRYEPPAGRAGGIIPAYAGSTPRTDTTKVPNTDHPRIRGEHHDDWLQQRVRRRIIPAYAGSTPARSGRARR